MRHTDDGDIVAAAVAAAAAAVVDGVGAVGTMPLVSFRRSEEAEVVF